MAKTTAKYEFMDNAFPAGQLKLAGDFHVVEDEKGEHMIFSVDANGRLCIILKGANGHNEWINLSQALQLTPEQKISAFTVSQNRDGKVHLVGAVRQADGSDKIFVLQPKAPTLAEWAKPDLSSELFSGDQWQITVRQILLGTSNDSTSEGTAYPQIYLIFKHQNKATEDIWAVSVDKERKAWVNQKAFQMPCNPDQIVDKCVANLKLYRGLFVLYKESASSPNATNLSFVGLNPSKKNPTLTTIIQKVPEGAYRLSSFDNSAGYTDLLVSGKDLTWRSAQQAFSGSKNPYSVISNEGSLTDLAQFRVAQSKDLLSVWGLRRDSLLSYQEFTIKDDIVPTARTPGLPLMHRDKNSDRFAALQHPKLGQKLFVIDKAGAMKMLEQDCQTAMWQSPIDVMIPDTKEVVEFKSHTVQIQVIDPSSGAPLPNKQLNLSCSTTAELIINGTSTRGTLDGQAVTTDVSGILTVIIKADSLSAPLLTLTDGTARDQFLSGPPLVVDPMSKLWSTVDSLKTKEDLKNMSLPDGTKFVKAGVSDDQLDQAAKALRDLRQVKNEMAPEAKSTLSEVKRQSQTSGDRLWGAWLYVREKLKEGWSWVVEKVGQAWQFVVEIAGKVWKFVLENFPQVAAAIQSVLEAISEGWEWVKRKFEFLFSWGDILDVKNIFVNLTTQGLLWGVDAVSLMEMRVDEYFDDLRTKVRSMKGKKLPKEMVNMKAGNDPALEQQARAERGESKVDEELKSPAANYGNYHLQHSGTDASKGTESSPTERLLKRMGDVWTQMETLGERCQTNMQELFKTKDVTVDDVFQKLGVDLLEDVIGVIQKVVVGVLGSFSDLILLLADGINKPINIPVLSPLYKRLTRGADLTILDALCLCLAIPATFAYKILTGEKPKDIVNVGDLVKLNAMKPELEQRMGRVKRDSLGATSGANGNPQAALNAVANATTRVTKEVSADLQAAAKKAQKRFIESGLTVSFLVKLGIPTGAQLWYTFNTWPKQMVPPTPYTFQGDMFSAFTKMVPWLGSFVGLFKFTSEEIKTRSVDIDKRFDDRWFHHRFRIWLLGALPVIGAMAGKEAGYCFALTTGVAQAGLLAWLQIESLVDGPGYSIYLAVEEWAKASGKISSAISGLTLGAPPTYAAAGVALGLTTIGASLNILRVGLEHAGKRDILATGMDVV